MAIPDDVVGLWSEYVATRDVELRNRLVLQYSPLVKYVAGRVRSGLPANVEQADLLSEGVIGLMDAIEKFEPDRGLQFQTYAVPRIRGAIIEGCGPPTGCPARCARRSAPSSACRWPWR